MAKLFLRVLGSDQTSHKSIRRLMPSDDHSAKELRRFKHGDIVTATIRHPRNPKHHRKFWALMNLVWESTAIQDRYASPRALAKAIELALGHFDTIKLSDGKTGFVIHSLSFENMSQDEFSEFYNRAIDVIVQQLVPHLNRKDLEQRVLEMIK